MNEKKVEAYKDLDKRVGEILLFEDGWDGVSGKKFNQELVNEFHTLVKSLIDQDLLNIPFYIIPCRNGLELQLEIMNGNCALEFSINSLGKKYLWAYSKENQENKTEEFSDDEAMEILIKYLNLMKD